MDTIQEKIRNRAYVIFCERGRIGGHEQDDWMQAEKEIGKDSLKEETIPSKMVVLSLDDDQGMRPAKLKRGKARTR